MKRKIARPKDVKWLKKRARRIVRKGRAIYGGYYEINAREMYLAWRHEDQLFRNGRGSVTEALHDGVAEWAMDNDTLLELSMDGIEIVGVVVRDKGTLYLTTVETFRNKGVFRDYSDRGGAIQLYLNIEHFRTFTEDKIAA